MTVAARIGVAAILILGLLVSSAMPSLAQDNLYRDLKACWDLNESSGIRYDHVGGANLTDNNTVGSDAGQNLGAASFVRANSEYLQLTHRSAFTANNHDWTIVFWVYPRRIDNGVIIAHWDYLQFEYAINIANGNLSLSTSSDGQTVSTTVLGSVIADTWYWVAIWQDASEQKIMWQIDDNSPGSIAWSGFYNSTASFYLGTTGFLSNYFDGLIDVVAIWHRVLSSSERSAIYESAYECADINNAPPTPTPGVSRRVDLSSGDWAIVRREVNYGDVMVGGLLGLVLVVFILGLIVWSVERWYGKS